MATATKSATPKDTAAKPNGAETGKVVKFSDLIVNTPTKSGYDSLKTLDKQTVRIANLNREGDAPAKDKEDKRPVVATLDDGRKFFVPNGKAKTLAKALDLAGAGNLVEVTISANEKRGFTLA